MEIWKYIKEFDGKYQISNCSRVKNSKTGRVLSLAKNISGYMVVHIGGKSRLLHRLVAQAFIPNPESKPEVNHIDEDKENNRVDNLEWVTRYENVNYGTRTSRAISSKGFIHSVEKRMISIVGKDVNGDEHFFKSLNEASRVTGVDHSNISKCLNGKRNRTGKYTWRKAIVAK